MKKENKKGISLITLVVTIIVVIIIAAAVILTLTKNNPIGEAKKAAFINDIATFQDQLELYKTNEYGKNLGDFLPSNLNATTQESVETVIPSLVGITKYENKIHIIKGKLIYVGTDEEQLKWAEEVDAAPVVYGGNAPVLASGMTPVKWDDSGALVTTTASDSNWYDYKNKKWANARTTDGSLWVWIPRYEYDIPTLNEHTNVAGSININFIENLGTTASSGYTVHPAFTFGTLELPGIWVAKFEASGTTSTIGSKPGATSLRRIILNTMFNSCLNMQSANGTQYGWGTTGVGLDTHLIKNVEWGAMAYLSNSKFGINTEVGNNTDTSTYYTGGGSGDSYKTNVLQSTTGNVYGIYDAAGGVYEITSAYVANGNSILSTNAPSLVAAASKYKDVYLPGDGTALGIYSANSGKKGDAVFETSSTGEMAKGWYTDYSNMPYGMFAFFNRSGFGDSVIGGIFGFSATGRRSNEFCWI